MGGTIAIDLGSSTTVIAHQQGDLTPQLVSLPPYSLLDPVVVPSLLWLSDADQTRPLMGRQVLEAGLAHDDSPGLQRDFKRRIACPSNPVSTDGLPLSPERAGALLLRRLWQSLPADLAPERLVLTAPIEAAPGYRTWLLEACRPLAVPEVALVDEPTAAAIGAGLPAGSTVLVVDLGGGTIDLCLVQLEGGEGRAAPIAQLLRFAGRDLDRSGQRRRCARVIGKAGLTIGGRDIDRWIADALCPDVAANGTLLEACERLKCGLSDREETLELWQGGDGVLRELRFSRAALERLLEERGLMAGLDQLLETVLAAGRAASIRPAAIAAVLPVGGSSRLPPVRRWLEERLAGVPIHDRRPVEAVALGALALTPGVRVQDVLARGVSLRCWDRRSGRHRWHPLFLPGQSWPTVQPLELVLACSRDRQEALELVLGEPNDGHRHEVVFADGLPQLRRREPGDAEVSAWPQQPAPVPLKPAGQAGTDRLRLRFWIDGGGHLMLESHDLLTGASPPAHRLERVR
ncbi:MAG: Hsp70 family protein [Cyanobium sp.]|nr:Hsp70 family protein [Cyanobium sp.]